MYRGKLRVLVEDDVLESLLKRGFTDEVIAGKLSENYTVPISRQNVTYWRKQWEARSPNARVHKFNIAGANRRIKKHVKVHEPSPKDWQAQGTLYDVGTECRYIVVIPDLHIPYHHVDALEFIAYNLAQAPKGYVVVNLGDEVDNHAISFHDADPNLDSAGRELSRSRESILLLHALVPQMLLCHSNHGSLHYRRAKAHGIPVEYLRTYREILFPDKGGEQWEWAYSHTLDTPIGQVMFKHQCGGDPRNAAAHEGCNLIVGHHHGRFDLAYGASRQRLYFGATAGCLLDRESLAYAYGRESTYKPILGMMIVEDGIPRHIPMVLDNDGRWIGRQK
jgi:hypothetical protein